VVEVWSGSALADLVLQDIDTSTGQVSAILAAGVPIYLRVYPQVPLSVTSPFTYSYNFTTTTNTLIITKVSDATTNPGDVVVHVGNLALGDTVNFYIDNNVTPALVEHVPVEDTAGLTVGTVFYIPLEEQLLYVSVPVDGFNKGTHTLTMTATPSGNQATISFLVLQDPFDPASTGIDTLPTVGATPHWIFKDTVPGGETYTWETGPASTTSPFAPRVITADHTTAPDGQPMEWEGTTKAAEWTLSGTLFTQTQLEAFQRFAALDHRVWLIDHLNRGWLVTVEELDAEPRRKGAQDFTWLHDWKMTLLVWRGPVDLT
jgi:hypothetical protein